MNGKLRERELDYSRLVFKNLKATEKILQGTKGIFDKTSGNKITEIQKDSS